MQISHSEKTTDQLLEEMFNEQNNLKRLHRKYESEVSGNTIDEADISIIGGEDSGHCYNQAMSDRRFQDLFTKPRFPYDTETLKEMNQCCINLIKIKEALNQK